MLIFSCALAQRGTEMKMLLAGVVITAIVAIILVSFVKSQIQKKREEELKNSRAIVRNECKICYKEMNKYIETMRRFYRERNETMPPEMEKVFIKFRNMCIRVIGYAQPFPTKEAVVKLMKQYEKIHRAIQRKMLQGRRASTLRSDAMRTLKVVDEKILISLQSVLEEVMSYED